MLGGWHKYSALAGSAFWIGTGILSIGSRVLSPLSWALNLSMGLAFIYPGWFLHLRSSSLYRFFLANSVNIKTNPILLHFLRLNLLLGFLSCLAGGLLLVASGSRVSGEGYAVFGESQANPRKNAAQRRECS